MDAITNSQILLHTIHKVLWNQWRKTKCVIANSHQHIYSAIESLVRPGQEIDIDHVDFHHDCCNEGDGIDCGNWLGWVLNDHPGSTATWYARLEGYDCQKKPDDLRRYVQDIVMDSLDDLIGRTYDLVFLCRSDAWTPPHLDKDFDDLVSICATMFQKVDCQVCVSEPRNMEDIMSMAKQLDDQFGLMAKILDKPKKEEDNHANRHTTS